MAKVRDFMNHRGSGHCTKQWKTHYKPKASDDAFTSVSQSKVCNIMVVIIWTVQLTCLMFRTLRPISSRCLTPSHSAVELMSLMNGFKALHSQWSMTRSPSEQLSSVALILHSHTWLSICSLYQVCLALLTAAYHYWPLQSHSSIDRCRACVLT